MTEKEMKIMKFLSLIICFFILTGYALAQTEETDSDIIDLIGTWEARNMKLPYYWQITYRQDGTWVGKAGINFEGNFINAIIKGTWELKGDKLRWKTTEVSHAGLPMHKDTSTILSYKHDMFICKMGLNGKIIKRYRVK